MKRLILPLIAALALPTSVNAETWWLLMRGREKLCCKKIAPTVSWTIPTESEQECNQEKDKIINLGNWKSNGEKRMILDAICVKGK